MEGSIALVYTLSRTVYAGNENLQQHSGSGNVKMWHLWLLMCISTYGAVVLFILASFTLIVVPWMLVTVVRHSRYIQLDCSYIHRLCFDTSSWRFPCRSSVHSQKVPTEEV